MGKVYFTSDLHFGHEKLCNGLRGMSASQSDKLIIDNWNSIVTKHDKVFILGDLSYDEPFDAISRLMKLKGYIQIIAGNHDNPKVVNKLIEKGYRVSSSYDYKGYLLTHMPCHPNELKFYKGNIHGHIHNQGKIIINGQKTDYIEENPVGNYLNVNTEFHDYKPISFDEVEQYFKNLKID